MVRRTTALRAGPAPLTLVSSGIPKHRRRMPLLPFDSFSIDTRLSASEAAERLAGAVEPRRWLRFGRGVKPFEGEVAADSFAIRRVIHYRNSFLPELRGRIEAVPSGSRV